MDKSPEKGSDPTISERIYNVPPDRRDWVIRARTALLQAADSLGPVKLSPIQRWRASRLDVPDMLEGVRKAGQPFLEAFIMEMMTDEEFERYTEKYLLKPPTPFQRVRQSMAGLLNSLNPFKRGIPK